MISPRVSWIVVEHHNCRPVLYARQGGKAKQQGTTIRHHSAPRTAGRQRRRPSDMVVGERDANSPLSLLPFDVTPTTYKTLPFRIHDDLYELIVPRLTHVSTSLLLLTVRHPPSSVIC